jgi:glycerophosphoryl diester phosphodiesterase
MELKSSLLYLFGPYIILSKFFYWFPFKSTNRKYIKKNKKFYVISHRGGAGEHIENTLAAFEQ